MLSLSSLASASGAADYYAQDNYYTADEASGASLWQGEGAEMLGLSGEVDAATFSAVLAGHLPDGSDIGARRGDHRPGLDLTFSAPKSLSLLALVGQDKRIVDALRGSVAATLKWAEKNLIETRVWNADEKRQTIEKSGNMIAATFLHDVNRNKEPQLHVHAVLANATKASDGQWHALRNDAFYQAQHLLGAVHNAELRQRIEALGYETMPARNPIDGAFEIKGVDRKTIDAFSTRSLEIRAALAQQGRGTAREREIAALATRQGKVEDMSPEDRQTKWQEVADKAGFAPQPLIDAALSRSTHQATFWTRLTDGIRGISAKGLKLASAMGITPKDGDPLVPERMGRLDPLSYAAAQAVASAARELGEREAAFSRHDLIRAALERGGPLTVTDIEKRIAVLEGKAILIGNERMMTSEATLRLEQHIITAAHMGRGHAAPIIDKTEAAFRVQAVARDMGLRRLNAGQEQAATTILSGRDRIMIVQGGAGVGKSAALGPVAQIVREEGRVLYALAPIGRTAREFGEKTGAKGMTVHSFLARYSHSPDNHADLKGAVIMVDEASMLGNETLARLVDLANSTGAERLILAGDTKQLPAIDAGKPFALMQDHGITTSSVTENLRAASPQMKALVTALEGNDIVKAFEILKPSTIAVPHQAVPVHAAKMWAALPKDERDKTLLLASGRVMRSAANEAAQAELKARGELGSISLPLTVFDRFTITREGARQIKAYREGRIVEFRSAIRSQGISKGERMTIRATGNGKVDLIDRHGELRQFDPSRLPRNLSHDAVTLFQNKELTLHEGDRIRWTDNDRQRDLLNGDMAHVGRIDGDSMTVITRSGEEHRLGRDDPMLKRLDLAYAINVHVAQGMTSPHGIVVMSERERMLNSAQSFLVAMTRIAEKVTLVVDKADGLERTIMRNPGGKSSAIETAQTATKLQLPLPEKAITLDEPQTRQRDRGMEL